MNKKTAKLSNSYHEMWQSQRFSFFEPLGSYPLERHPDKQNIAFMLAGTALFCTDINVAKRLFEKACSLTKKPVLIQQFMLAALNIQFGKALLVADQPAKALEKFIEAWQMGNSLLQPLFYGFMCEAAEQLLNAGDTRAAIQAWQDIATVLQQETPEHVYHRMSHCYAVNSKGFGGTPEQNNLWGDCYKHDVLDYFHAYLQPDFYFEIGVDEGLSLVKARGKALGVDARPTLKLKVDLPDTTKILGMSSDAFFNNCAATEFSQAPDLAFIDGMHLFEFALRDFINFERFAAPSTLVVIDDIFPCHPVQAERRRVSNAWTGDVWKIIPILKHYRPDLYLLPIRSHTTGLLLIAGLDPTNTTLTENYSEILADYQNDIEVPAAILAREGSVPSNHACVELLLYTLKTAKQQKASLEGVRKQLQQLTPFTLEAMRNCHSLINVQTINALQNKKQLEQLQLFNCQLFLPGNTANVYSEENSLHSAFSGIECKEVEFNFKLALSNNPLRFDPAFKTGLFEIVAITLFDVDNNKALLYINDASGFDKLTTRGDLLRLKVANRFVFYSYGNDPIIFLPLIECAEVSLRLTISIRNLSDIFEQKKLWQLHL